MAPHTVIFKYQLNITDEQSLFVPQGFRPLSVGNQHGQVTMWAEVKALTPDRYVKVRIIGTGNMMPNMAGFHFVGTVFQDPFVWHVYAEET